MVLDTIHYKCYDEFLTLKGVNQVQHRHIWADCITFLFAEKRLKCSFICKVGAYVPLPMSNIRYTKELHYTTTLQPSPCCQCHLEHMALRLW